RRSRATPALKATAVLRREPVSSRARGQATPSKQHDRHPARASRARLAQLPILLGPEDKSTGEQSVPAVIPLATIATLQRAARHRARFVHSPAHEVPRSARMSADAAQNFGKMRCGAFVLRLSVFSRRPVSD